MWVFQTIFKGIWGFGYTPGKCSRPAPATKQGGVVAFGEATWGSWDSPFCCLRPEATMHDRPRTERGREGRARGRAGREGSATRPPLKRRCSRCLQFHMILLQLFKLVISVQRFFVFIFFSSLLFPFRHVEIRIDVLVPVVNRFERINSRRYSSIFFSSLVFLSAMSRSALMSLFV